MNRIRWAEGAWALLVLLAAVMMACGLADAFTFLVEPPTYPVGHRLVLLGALGFAAAAVWAWLRPVPRWVTVLTALPANTLSENRPTFSHRCPAISQPPDVN
ncbi:hypothetical protein [Arthrobacter sp. Soil762]|uniref:hypothetical protein n=1 Tax=Arthrobacter sp. Soil762 TaxID=1736401 RepID=UPI0012E38BDE|nr:hypothetical protein [Arthrobacter sp. Soil762]